MMTFALTTDDRRALLSLARQAIFAHLTRGPAPRCDAPVMSLRLGAFVSLHVRGELRGCIGCPQADRPLGETIIECAVDAATRDPRFPHLALSELPAVLIEISVLGPIEPVRDVTSDIIVGRHGLIVAHGYCRGLLLPQVAAENGWNRETFLAHTCQKAGLRRDAWQCGAQISRFEADVFAEEAEPI